MISHKTLSSKKTSHSLRTKTMIRNQLLAVLTLSALLSGCYLPISAAPAPDYYYLDPQKDLSAIGRVAIMELSNQTSYPQISADVTESLFQALQKKQLFSLKIIRMADPAWHNLGPDAGSNLRAQTGFDSLSLEQLVSARKRLNCDAVLLGAVTVYQPYPNLILGLSIKLIDLSDGQVIWAVEQVWDSADKTMENPIKAFFQKQMCSDPEGLQKRLVEVSPLQFVRFVTHEVAQTLAYR